MKVKILGLDPGTKNFGYAITSFDIETGAFKPVLAGKIQNPVTHMDETVQQTSTFLKEIGDIIDNHNISYIVAERFLNRGRFNGATGEYVSFMLGSIATYLLNNNRIKALYIVHSGTWKTAYNRLSNSKKFLDRVYKYTLSEPHELDAYLLTHFCFKELFGGSAFGHLGKPLTKKQIQAFETVSTGKKKRARK